MGHQINDKSSNRKARRTISRSRVMRERKRKGKAIITSLSPFGKLAVIKGRELRATPNGEELHHARRLID